MPTEPTQLPRLGDRVRVERLDNGLTVCLLPSRQVPLAATALSYRTGTRDEPPGQWGLAHFLEHMMFKGAARYGPGEIDRRTQQLGGANNAYTSHDSTVYYFSFAGDRWREALAIEADRMAGLTLSPREVEAERRVILEEIAEAEDDPWDRLESEVRSALFGGGHPYGRPILGTAAALGALGRPELDSFHRHGYRPDAAVLAVAGDLGDGVLDEVAATLGRLPAAGRSRPGAAAVSWPTELRRVERRQGETARLLLGLPAPPAASPDYAPLRLLLTVLAGGRASRLHRLLVDEGQLSADVGSEIDETEEAGMASIALELLPGVEPERAEELLFAELERAVAGAVEPAELARAKQLLKADWVFANERVLERALTVATAVSLFDLDYPDRHLEEVEACGADRLAEVAKRYLRPESGAVVGRSLPRASS